MKKLDVVEFAVDELVNRLKEYSLQTYSPNKDVPESALFSIKRAELDAYTRVLAIIQKVKGETPKELD